MQKILKKFFFSNYLLIGILSLATFLRLYRINELLGFWYDQGRDALVIWDMIYKGKLTLIGPMMGFTGMFRGPWYYYLITPFYWLGHGNPIFPSVFLISTTVLAIYFLFLIGEKLGSKNVGLFAALVASVSAYIISSSRWFSDPTPTLLVSVLLIWATFKYHDKKVWALPLIGFLIGMSLQFSASTEIFYIPAFLVILYLFRKLLPKFKVIFLSGISFLVPFLFQALFELRHLGTLSGALFQFIFKEKTFSLSFWKIIETRLPFYYSLFASKFWFGNILFAPFFIIFLITLILKWREFWHNDKFKIIFVLSIGPFIGTLFFVSNLGAIYDYYFTGYYLIWILLFSFVILSIPRSFVRKFILIAFFALLIFENCKSYITSYFISLNDPKIVVLGNELKAIDWIYRDANGRNFNVDEYVPPVIPYTYEYLFEWLGHTKYNQLPDTSNVKLLYTLEEADFDHPDRIAAWYARQNGIGKVEEKVQFGGITVERRLRYENKK